MFYSKFKDNVLYGNIYQNRLNRLSSGWLRPWLVTTLPVPMHRLAISRSLCKHRKGMVISSYHDNIFGCIVTHHQIAVKYFLYYKNGYVFASLVKVILFNNENFDKVSRNQDFSIIENEKS